MTPLFHDQPYRSGRSWLNMAPPSSTSTHDDLHTTTSDRTNVPYTPATHHANRREVSRSSCRHRPPDPVTPLQIHESEYNSHDANWTSGAEKSSDRLTECTVRLNVQSAVYIEKCSHDGPQNGNKERLRSTHGIFWEGCGPCAGQIAFIR
jgi:hypothetical protein